MGNPSTLKGDYNVSNFSYPEDITTSDEYGGNYVVIFINRQSESKLFLPSMGSGAESDYIESIQRGLAGGADTLGYTSSLKQIGEASVVTGAALATGGVAIAKSLSEISLNKVSLPGLVSSLFGSVPVNEETKKAAEQFRGSLTSGIKPAVIAGALTAAVAHNAGKFSAPVKRLKTAIALHIPNQLAIKYGVSYEDIDTNFVAGMNETTQLHLGNTYDWGTAKGLESLPMIGKTIQHLSKTAPNPMKEQIFRSVDNRTFQFSYKFSPKNPTEAKHVLNIIQALKFHMHPEYKDETGFLYIFPSEFDIAYYTNSDRNTALHSHTSCVLTSMSLDYTPTGGGFSTFKTPIDKNGLPDKSLSGMPTQINMTLEFKELATLDKQKIKDGGF